MKEGSKAEMARKMVPALILAGGLGTRLSSLFRNYPKALAPIAGKPFLEYLLLYLKKHGFFDIVLCVGYKADLIQRYCQDGKQWGMSIRYSREQMPLGTAGPLKVAGPLIPATDFLVLNGDSFFNIDLNTLVRYHKSRKALATIALAKVNNAQRYGTVEVDSRGKIVKFIEKEQTEKAGLINGGIYVFHRKVLDLIPEGRAVSLEYEIFPKLVGKAFYGLPFEAYFVDIGVPEDYLELQADPSRLLAAVTERREEPC
jgi:D-glycero-alpha-D-manno-heptose 1-phosphate guanylyltransferase